VSIPWLSAQERPPLSPTGSVSAAVQVPGIPSAFTDPDRPLAERVADLIGRMTTEEKVAYMDVEPPPIPRLGIPGFSWRNEGLHGVWNVGRATVFPHCIAMAATWNTGLVFRIGSAIGDEARVKHREKPTTRFHGLTCWAPEVDLVRDPRWGRTMETYGEDPHLVGQCAIAFIRGIQGNHHRYIKMAATVKHFAVYGQETNRQGTNLNVSARMLREYYLVPFRLTLAEGGASSVMTAFTGLNGVPCVANRDLVTGILRGEWGFQGPVVSDVNAPVNLKEHHKFVSTFPEAVAVSIRAGVDVLCMMEGVSERVTTNVLAAVKQGLVTEAQLDQALVRNLGLRFRLGMFDPPERVPWTQIPDSVVGCSEHVSLAREASRQSIVLLKNGPPPHRANPTPLLPLDRHKLESIAVVGPYADSFEFGTVTPNPPAEPVVTALAGIQNHVEERIVVRGVPWFDPARSKKLSGPGKKPPPTQQASVEAALKAAARSDAVIAVLGLNSRNEYEGKDRLDLDLPKEQQEFVEKLVAVNPSTAVVLINGGALSVNWLQQHVPAILEAWYPGEQGGNAIADILFGDANPAGRLPITFYASMEQLLPMGECEISRGLTYMYLKGVPLYPFGHGLSYTRFEYRNLHLDREKVAAGDTLQVSVDVKNVGARDGDEVVQCYVRVPGADHPVPIRQLRGFQRIPIPAGQTRAVNLPIKIADLASWSEEKDRWVLRPGSYEVQIGASSADIRLRAAVTLE
jgi:beta-glucosidase